MNVLFCQCGSTAWQHISPEVIVEAVNP